MLIPDSKPLNDYKEEDLREKCYGGGREGGKQITLTPAQKAMCNLLDGINALPAWEQAEVAEVKEILDRLVLRYGASAHLAMMGVCINVAIEKGE